MMRHELPPIPVFRDSLPSNPIQEIALRIVVELPGWQFFAIGTAVLIAKNLAITANHVLGAAIRKFRAKHTTSTVDIDGFGLKLFQVLPGPIYRVWNVTEAWACPSDIAILHLSIDRCSESNDNLVSRVARLRAFPLVPGKRSLLLVIVSLISKLEKKPKSIT